MASSSQEFFPHIRKIEYEPDAGAADTLVFKHYNASEMVLGKTMGDWLRFSVCFWHSFRGIGADPFGLPTINRIWDDGTNSLENAQKRLQAAFEFFRKLGNKFWTFHDRDIAPEGQTLEETNRNLDKMVKLALELQRENSVKLLWATCNLFCHPRYMNGAASNPDSHVVAYAAAQLKKGLDIAKLLDAQNYVFWGGREGYTSLLNTNLKMELDNLASFYRMAVAYKKKIGFQGQFLIEPKPREPASHQYDYDAMTAIAFLKTYGLDKDFKLNIEPNHTTLAGHSYTHDIAMASSFSMLGSIDANTGTPELGWDTDQFPMDIRNTTLVMLEVLKNGGIHPGGLNFDAKVRRESIRVEDLFIAHIGAMDAFARGLKNAAKIISDKVFQRGLDDRYESFQSGIGKNIVDGNCSLEECENRISRIVWNVLSVLVSVWNKTRKWLFALGNGKSTIFCSGVYHKTWGTSSCQWTSGTLGSSSQLLPVMSVKNMLEECK